MNDKHEAPKWIWTELLAFDVKQPDYDGRNYLDTLGFVPDVISLLISTPDMILQHEGMETDRELPGDFCSRDGQEGNGVRPRQVWTAYQVRDLIARLRAAGAKVYLSSFVHYLNDRFHREWLTDHPECKQVRTDLGRCEGLNVLARMSDGSYLEDYFASQLARVCVDYGFDGWQGADGHGPLNVPLHIVDCSDDMIGQFIDSGQCDLPDVVTVPSHDKPGKLQARMAWIWKHKRLEWIEFYTNRWARFWGKTATALQAVERKAVVNSGWTRDPFEAIYRYGVDYGKLVEAGVDGIVVEHCASCMSMYDRRHDYHFDHLAMSMLYKAYLPNTQLMNFLLTKDVFEDWDVMRHCPPLLERELYSVNSVFHIDHRGQMERSNSGFFVCLADGMSRQEWDWIDQKLTLAYDPMPLKTLGATLVWSDQSMHRQVREFPQTRSWSSHHLMQELMRRNGPVQATVRIEDVDKVDGFLLMANPHLLPHEQRRALLNSGKPLMTIGDEVGDWPAPAFELVDIVGASTGVRTPMRCRIYNSKINRTFELNDTIAHGHAPLPADLMTVAEPPYFKEPLAYRPVGEAFLCACADMIRSLNGGFSVDSEIIPDQMSDRAEVAVMLAQQTADTVRLWIRSTMTVYCRPRIVLGRKIRSVNVRTIYPAAKVKPDGTWFHVAVPPRGIVVADVQFENSAGGFQ